jgi:hypothetical protein
MEVFMELRQALLQIEEIRASIARTETFTGSRSPTVALTGLLAFVAAGLQRIWLPSPIDRPLSWVGLWVTVAAVNFALVLCEMLSRCLRARSPHAWTLTRLALLQFCPCLIAGGGLTAVIAIRSPDLAWFLPGLWSILFSLGLFASGGLLPKPIYLVACYYLAAGVSVLMLELARPSLAWWTMGATFGIGQFLVASVLYCCLERNHER